MGVGDNGRERTTHGEAFWADPLNAHLTRCNADYRNGERCRAEAIPGGNVCSLHGGGASQVRRKAAERVVLSADAAVEKIIGFINDPDIPAGIRLKAAQDIADRAGLAAAQIHKVVVAENDPMNELFRELLAAPDALEDVEPVVLPGEVVRDEVDYPPPPQPLQIPAPKPKTVHASSSPPAWLRRELKGR